MLRKGINLLSRSSLGYSLLSESFKLKERFRPSWIDRPTTLQLDTQNFCNLRCVYCNVKRGGPYCLDRGVMDLSLIERALQDVKGSVYCVAPFMNGEPLLEKRLPQINDLIQGIGAKSVIDTNGSLYENRELLLHRNLFLVRFTISARDAQTYRMVHGQDVFEDALKTLYWFEAHRYSSQKIMLHFIANRFNEDQIEDYLRLFSGFKIRVFPVHEAKDQGASSTSKGSQIFEDNRPVIIDEHGKRSIEKLKPNYPCQCWDILAIGFDGSTLQCPDVPYSANYGNLKEVALKDMWKQRNLNRMKNKYCVSCSVRSPKSAQLFDFWLGRHRGGSQQQHRRRTGDMTL